MLDMKQVVGSLLGIGKKFGVAVALADFGLDGD